jgi:3-hydroxybutyryl-CoA dehydrogenase
VAQITAATARSWGKVAVHARSTPGFIVNRVARPFYAEALRLYEEGCADPATLDALMVEGAGFRMGPFALMDLIGHDVNFDVTQAVFNAYHHDPRYRPSLIQQEWVEAGWLGRKSGRGVFSYAPGVDMPGPQTETLTVQGVLQPFDAERVQYEGVIVARTDGRTAARRACDSGKPVILYDAMTGEGGKRVALTQSPNVDASQWHGVVEKFQQLGLQVSRIKDLPGMVVMRTVAMLANEAADAVNQGVCSAADANLAMQKGVNYPIGPLAWAERIGLNGVMRVLQNLAIEYGEDRYRVSPLIRRKVASGTQF